MKTLNYNYMNVEELRDFISTNDMVVSENILIQVFSGVVDETHVLGVCSELKSILPQANIIGTTTAGEIFNGKMLDAQIIISFSIFETTKIKSKLYENHSEKESARSIVDELVGEDTKVLIIFSDGLRSNGEEFLNELAVLNPDLIISGGRAGDNNSFNKTFVFDENMITNNGFVVASLNGKDLIANNDYILNWERLGVPMQVTKAEKNRLYELNNIPIVDIYEKYLGHEISLSLPEAATEFPFLLKRGSVDVARAPIALMEDNSLLFGGNIENGEEVSFSFANAKVINEKNREKFKKIQEFPIESIFVYSCSVRKDVLGKDLESELELYELIAPTVGFFTYGEFFHSKCVNELLNITSTYLTLSESSEITKKDIPEATSNKKSRNLIALSHLVSTTSQELIKAQDVFNLTHNIMELGSWELDIATEKFWWSDETYKIFNLDKKEFQPTYEAYLNIIHPEDRELVKGSISMSLEYDIPYKVEHRLLPYTSNAKTVLEQGIIKRDDDGNPLSIVGTIQNITELKKNEKELLRLRDKAVESERSKSNFLANMSHEIRTPLNAILGFISLLKDEETNPKKSKYLNIVSESSNHLLGIINDILDMSKIESKKLEIERISFDLKYEMDNLYNLFSATADQNKIQLKYFYSEGIPSYIKADPLRIKQIVSNLLSNALKFTGENGIVELNVEYYKFNLKITVSDSGIGIEEDKLEHIFDQFSQVDLSTSRKYGGTGLGLNISKQLCDLMGGELSVKSRLGDGTSFALLLYAPESEKEKVDTIDIEDIQIEGKILVAEDNKTNQLLISILLDELGLDFTLVENGQEAAYKCMEEEFDLVLMDINMPVMNGIEALHYIRNDLSILETMRSVPILALTANAIKGDKESYMEEGMDGYIPKPIDKTQLVEELLKFLSKK